MPSASRAILLLAAVALVAPALAGCVTPWSPEAKNKRSGPGDDARLFIRGDPYGKLHIVIDYVVGYAPNDAAIQTMKATLASVLDKREITISKHATIPAKGDSHGYTLEEINEIEGANRKDYHDGDTAVMYFLYLDGSFQSGTGPQGGCTLGAAYHGSSIVMFKNCIRRSVRENTGLLGPGEAELESIIERSVLIHEMGHNLGLVDNGIPMVRDHLSRSPDHTPKHSSNAKSVMYWAVESSAGIANLVKLTSNTNIPYQFDADDKADIENVKKGG